jgi:pyridoxamine 5'-phosphate oxidase
MTDARIASLSDIGDAVWQQLTTAATADKQHAWRTPVLATTDGDVADARTVVLREADAQARRLWLYSDVRAAKVAQLLSHPVGTLVMWSPDLGWQLRCRVELALEASGLATSSRWARVKLSPALNDYLSPLPPGTTLAAQAPRPGDGIAEGRDHFGVITARVLAIDWLELHAQGHRRARFDDNSDGVWLQP